MSKIVVCYTVFYAVSNSMQHVAAAFPVWEYIIVNCVITCRFALKMSIGLQMRNAQNLWKILSSQFIAR